MTKRSLLILLLGAVPATVWSVLSLDLSWQPHWTVTAWLGAIALWTAALTPDYSRLPVVARVLIAIGLVLGIFVAVFPMGFNVLFLAQYAVSLSLKENLTTLAVIAALLVPIATAVHCVITLFRPAKPLTGDVDATC